MQSCKELECQFNPETECEVTIEECANDILRAAIAFARKHDSCFVLSLLRAAVDNVSYRLNEKELSCADLVAAGFTHVEAHEDLLAGLIHETPSGEYVVPATLDDNCDAVMTFDFYDAAMA